MPLIRLLTWFRQSWGRPWTEAKWAFAAMVVTMAIGGFFGLWILRRLSWVGDLVALALPAAFLGLSVVLLGLLVTRQAWLLDGAVLGLLVSAVLGIGLPRLPESTGRPTRSVLLAAVNLRFDSARPKAGATSALALHADVLVVSELTERTDRLLSQAYPYRAVNEEVLRTTNYTQGVYSKVPLEDTSEPAGLGGQALRVRVVGPKPFVLFAVHLPRPTLNYQGNYGMTSFAEHRTETERLDAMARGEVGPVVIAGDLNMSDRTRGYDILDEGRIDALRTGWAASTYVGGFEWELLMLRIDHIFIPGDWCTRGGHTVGLDGSDHHGVSAEIGPCSDAVSAGSTDRRDGG